MTQHVDVWAPIILVVVLGYLATYGLGFGH